MGHWAMHVEGHGIHDNQGNEHDADEMLKRFAEHLRQAGHQVLHVSFTAGSSKTLPVSDTGSVESPAPEYVART